MIRWTPKIPAPTPQRWQSRKEILNEYLGTLSPDEMLRSHPYHWALRYGRSGYTRKYDPNQPRDERGRWVDADGNQDDLADNPLESFAAARRRGNSLAYCTAQYAADALICKIAKSRACWEQAALRWSNCLAGRPIPPLNY
jgi:hypothetical protein